MISIIPPSDLQAVSGPVVHCDPPLARAHHTQHEGLPHIEGEQQEVGTAISKIEYEYLTVPSNLLHQVNGNNFILTFVSIFPVYAPFHPYHVFLFLPFSPISNFPFPFFPFNS